MPKNKLGRKSKSELIGVHPLLAACAWLTVEQLAEHGLDASVFDGLRTYREQLNYYKRGTSKTMRSRHLLGQAIDLVPYINGRNYWDSKDPELQDEITRCFDFIYEIMNENAEMLGIKLKTFSFDRPHFQIEGSDWNIKKLNMPIVE